MKSLEGNFLCFCLNFFLSLLTSRCGLRLEGHENLFFFTLGNFLRLYFFLEGKNVDFQVGLIYKLVHLKFKIIFLILNILSFKVKVKFKVSKLFLKN